VAHLVEAPRQMFFRTPQLVATGLVENAEYRFFSDARDVRRADVLPILCARYDITENDILEVEALFDDVRSLPWFVSHPAIVRIMEVDYS
jgi:hypothetical protein